MPWTCAEAPPAGTSSNEPTIALPSKILRERDIDLLPPPLGPTVGPSLWVEDLTGYYGPGLSRVQ